MPWPDVLAQARAAFPARGKADYHLCLSHNTRKRVNKLVQRQRAQREGIRIDGKGPLGQPMWIQRGTRLICCLEQSKHGLYNSQLLTVTTFNEKTVSVECLATGAEHVLSHQWVAERTRLGYCFTIASAQGQTLFGSVALWDVSHPRYSLRHLFTSLSRGQNFENEHRGLNRV